MNSTKGELNICSRGHRFYKSSSCPVCPKCWRGYYHKQFQADFPARLGAPALRGLLNAKIKSLAALSRYTEAEIAELHGLGPKALKQLKASLKKRGLKFTQ